MTCKGTWWSIRRQHRRGTVVRYGVSERGGSGGGEASNPAARRAKVENCQAECSEMAPTGRGLSGSGVFAPSGRTRSGRKAVSGRGPYKACVAQHPIARAGALWLGNWAYGGRQWPAFAAGWSSGLPYVLAVKNNEPPAQHGARWRRTSGQQITGGNASGRRHQGAPSLRLGMVAGPGQRRIRGVGCWCVAASSILRSRLLRLFWYRR